MKPICFLLLVSLLTGGDKLVSLDLEKADIQTVLRGLAEISGVNIVASPSVKGEVTVHIKRVPWRSALEIVLESAGYKWIEENGVIKVMTASELEATRKLKERETRIFKIKYSKASKMEPIVKEILSESGKVKAEEGTNSLVVTDYREKLEEVRDLLIKLDKPTPQVLIKAKLVQVDYGAMRDIGFQWGLGNLSSAKNPTHYSAVLTTPPSGERGAIYFSKLTRDLKIEAIISALEDENRAEILSEPSIIVQDNEEAMILSGKKIPIVTRDFAGNQIIKFYDVALKLTVTPHITPDGKIILDLHPEISDIAGQAPGAVGPVISSQEAKTKLTLKDGESVVIGGIIKTVDENVKEGVPILSKIPLLGWLFSHTQKKKTKSELLIFVTPEIIKANE